MNETSQMLIGRRMRCAEEMGEAPPEEIEALVQKTLAEMEEVHCAQDRWIAMERPGGDFDVWHREIKRREKWRWLSRLGWNLAACLGVGGFLLLGIMEQIHPVRTGPERQWEETRRWLLPLLKVPKTEDEQRLLLSTHARWRNEAARNTNFSHGGMSGVVWLTTKLRERGVSVVPASISGCLTFEQVMKLGQEMRRLSLKGELDAYLMAAEQDMKAIFGEFETKEAAQAKLRKDKALIMPAEKTLWMLWVNEGRSNPAVADALNEMDVFCTEMQRQGLDMNIWSCAAHCEEVENLLEWGKNIKVARDEGLLKEFVREMKKEFTSYPELPVSGGE